MEKAIDCVLDNLVIYVEGVRTDVFEKFRIRLNQAESDGKVPPMRLTIGQGYSEYHYRLNVGQGGGAVTIGFKHNSAKSNEIYYTMRVEFNPQKNPRYYEGFWEEFRVHFAHHTKRIKSFDLAFDIPVSMKKLFAVSLTGKQKAHYKGTQYFGSSGNTGRLKIYDKKKELEEKQGVTVLEEERTRIEYTIRLAEPMIFHLLAKADTNINSDYEIVYLNVEKLTGEIKSAVLAIHHDYMKINEFTRTTKIKIKEALKRMEKLDLDHAYNNARDKIMTKINSYLKQV